MQAGRLYVPTQTEVLILTVPGFQLLASDLDSVV